jgi:hypothetical protein
MRNLVAMHGQHATERQADRDATRLVTSVRMPTVVGPTVAVDPTPERGA